MSNYPIVVLDFWLEKRIINIGKILEADFLASVFLSEKLGGVA